MDPEIGTHSSILKAVGTSLESYENSFNNVSSLTEEIKNFLIEYHPQADGIAGLW